MGQLRIRNAVTKKGVLRRIRDAELSQVTDRRDERGKRHPQLALTHALLLGVVVGCRSLREVEQLTTELTIDARRELAVRDRISDTTLGTNLAEMDCAELRAALHRQVKEEHRRGRLGAELLPLNLVAIDGKCLAKTSSWAHPGVQVHRPEGRAPYGLARVHRAHLVSAKAAVCVDAAAIPGDTNEIGAVCEFTSDMLRTYGRTTLIDAIIADAGNCSLKHATLINSADVGYILALKETAGDIHQEALRLLGALSSEDAEEARVTRERGGQITYRVYRASISGYLGWKHARQLVRIQRVVARGGSESEGNRYFVTNLPTGRLTPRQWLTAVRAYWRCENEGNWTADAVWDEDARRTPWTRSPSGIFALGLLRMLAFNIISVLRALSRLVASSDPPPWRMVILTARFAVAPPALCSRGQLACE